MAGEPQKHCISSGSAKEMLLATKADAIKSYRKILIFKCYFALANTNVCSFGFSQRYFQVFTGKDTWSPQSLDKVNS